jgi:hypothetical protein
MAAGQGTSQLLQLPDPCLLVVLQCCADDLHSLFNAARAHSRLHQAAVQALSSVTVSRIQQQQQLDGLLRYLSKYGHQVDLMDLACSRFDRISLCQLPDHLHLSSLKLAHLDLQLQPGSGVQGLVRPGVPLKQLQLHDCDLLDGAKGLAAALTLLPRLQHFSFRITKWTLSSGNSFPMDSLSALQQLTYLEIAVAEVRKPSLQPLQALTRLVDLRLSLAGAVALDSSMVAGAKHLTRLELIGRVLPGPDALATLTQLQHLQLGLWDRLGQAVAAQLLPQLQHLQQLTHLRLSPNVFQGASPPAAAFSALTASSKLQHLDISGCKLAARVWQHMFPAGRQLLFLQFLDISCVKEPGYDPAPAPDGSRLVSCCPGLQRLDIRHLQCSAKRLASLTGLSRLHTLRLASRTQVEGVEAVLQLTGLRELQLQSPESPAGLPLQLAQLKQLTHLYFSRTEAADGLWTSATVSCFKSGVSYSYSHSYSIWHGRAVQPTREPEAHGVPGKLNNIVFAYM